MKCVMCGRELERPVRATVDYPADIPVVLVDVEVMRCPDPDCGEEEVVIPDVERLHALLVEAVAAKQDRLTPAEIRFLRKSMGWSGKDFAHRFDTTAVTVSRWENGASAMNRQAELLLRLLATVLPPIQEYTCSGAIREEADAAATKRALQHGLALLGPKHRSTEQRGLTTTLVDGRWRVPGALLASAG